jgi:biotin transport system substrate-specific component
MNKMKKSKFRALDITYVGMFAALMMIGANITSLVPFMTVGGVPITLQTFFAVLAGAALGSRLGSLSMIVYTLVGIIGAPVFAQFSGGAGIIINPNFGFILSFIIAAYAVGKIVERKQTISSYIAAALVGMIINYVVGTNWMYAAYKLWYSAPSNFSYKMAWTWMVVPLPKDIILSVFAGILAQRLHKSVRIKSNIFQH